METKKEGQKEGKEGRESNWLLLNNNYYYADIIICLLAFLATRNNEAFFFLISSVSRKRKWINIIVHTSCVQSCLALCDSMDCRQPGSLSMEFSRQEYWKGLAFPPSGDLPEPGIEPVSPKSPILQVGSLPPWTIGKAPSHLTSGTSKGSFTTLLQLKKFPDIPVSTREEARGSRPHPD